MSTLAILKIEFEKMNYRKDRSHPVFLCCACIGVFLA